MGFGEGQAGRELKERRKRTGREENMEARRGKTDMLEHMRDMIARPGTELKERLRLRGGWGTLARPRGWRKPAAAARGLRAQTGQARLLRQPVPAMGRQEQAGEEEHMQALMEQEEK